MGKNTRKKRRRLEVETYAMVRLSISLCTKQVVSPILSKKMARTSFKSVYFALRHHQEQF